jgi:hypothetical protein
LGASIWVLDMGRRRLRPDSGEPAALLAGEVVELDHTVTYGLGVTEVGAEKSPAWVHGEGRQWSPRRLGSCDRIGPA